MAKIILAPNESFEHFHSEESTTVLLQGSARYETGNRSQEMETNVTILTPAHQSHTITNTGNMECIFGCGH